jgi:putative toxin-antitoxin system antitoxin component (TIGR02293 family)
MTNVPDFLTPIIPDADSRVEFYSLALEIFGTDQEIETWLSSPNVFLGNECPLDLLKTSIGTARVLTYLSKIESGTYI